LNVDPGVAYYFIDEKSTQLWAEGGYDLQYDVRRDENIEAVALTGENLDKTETRHNGRLFAGYENNISDNVSFNSGVEYLQDVQEGKNRRINLDVGLSSSIGKGFSLATTFSLKYDHNPLPEVEKTDTITAVSLVYKLL
jgi:putative salt-induced outer membrane protein